MLPEAVLAFGQYAFSLKMWSRHMDGTPDSADDTEKNFISCPAGFENIVSLSYFARQHGAGKKMSTVLKPRSEEFCDLNFRETQCRPNL